MKQQVSSVQSEVVELKRQVEAMRPAGLGEWPQPLRQDGLPAQPGVGGGQQVAEAELQQQRGRNPVQVGGEQGPQLHQGLELECPGIRLPRHRLSNKAFSSLFLNAPYSSSSPQVMMGAPLPPTGFQPHGALRPPGGAGEGGVAPLPDAQLARLQDEVARVKAYVGIQVGADGAGAGSVTGTGHAGSASATAGTLRRWLGIHGPQHAACLMCSASGCWWLCGRRICRAWRRRALRRRVLPARQQAARRQARARGPTRGAAPGRSRTLWRRWQGMWTR